MIIELNNDQVKELYCCYIVGCRGNSPRKIDGILDKKIKDAFLGAHAN